jgi:hypothetical protein
MDEANLIFCKAPLAPLLDYGGEAESAFFCGLICGAEGRFSLLEGCSQRYGRSPTAQYA